MLQHAFGSGREVIYLRTRSDRKLFNLARLRAESKVQLRCLRDFLFADEAAVTVHSAEDLQQLMTRLSEASQAFGHNIILKKTQVKGHGVDSPPNIGISDYKLEVVDDFVYLGSTISDSLALDMELNIRIDVAPVVLPPVAAPPVVQPAAAVSGDVERDIQSLSNAVFQEICARDEPSMCAAATVVVLLAGLGAADVTSEGGANSAEADDTERERRHSLPLTQSLRPYGVLPPHTPAAFLTPYSIFASHPTLVSSQVSNSLNLGGVLDRPVSTPVITPFIRENKLTINQASFNQLAGGPLLNQGVYTPSRTPAVTQPFLGPASGLGPRVTPVPHHLRPLQPSINTYGVKTSNQFFIFSLVRHLTQFPSYAPVRDHSLDTSDDEASHKTVERKYDLVLSYIRTVTRHFPGQTHCPNGLQCVPLVSCAPCYHQVENQPQLSCSIYGGAVGVCCPGQPNNINLRQLFVEPEIVVPQLGFSNDLINGAVRVGLGLLAEVDLLEAELQARDFEVTDFRDPAFGHLQFFKTSPLAIRLSRGAFVSALASDQLMTQFRLSPLQAGFGLQQFDLSNTIIAESCPRNPACRERDVLYRTIDGSCNNLDNPMWGQARTTFQRLCPPSYSDGLFRPRRSVLGGPLPSARLVSTSISGDVDNPSPDYTLSLMQWGQFIDHDLAHTPINRLSNTSGIQCCGNNGTTVAEAAFLHPACFPIDIPENDPFFGGTGDICMNFVRSMFAPRTNPCSLGYAEQMNQITHYLDGSNIYGSSRQEEQQLRLFRGGLLRVQETDLLPADPEAMECVTSRDGIPCFMAGDNRVNEQILLSVIHTVWVRMHNRIARELARLNPHWSDETIYQETRRIVVAIYQHIIYNEWLPIILGKDYMAANGLLPQREGFSRDYDSSLNAAVLNEFATAAFRFGHSLVQGMIRLVGKKGMKDGGTLLLHDNFNNPQHIYTPGRLDQFLRGLATQPIQQFDNFVTSSLTNRLFQTPQMPFGMDLVALNTQRGRDHGIAPYNKLREACGLPRARTFADLLDVIRPEVVNVFQQLYASVDDIDPFVAGISERPAPGALVGPTFRCIIGDQFTRLKRGDRFFYDLAGMPSSFSEAQLNSIRMMSWARVLCETGDMLGYVQPLAFRQPRGLNERVPCDSPGIPGLDLTPWISRVKK
nr:chorion peroxidase-like [Procambarus clarkii]